MRRGYWQAENGVKEVVSFLESYDITKDDWDNVVELCKLPGTPDVLSQIPAKVMRLLVRNGRQKLSHIHT